MGLPCPTGSNKCALLEIEHGPDDTFYILLAVVDVLWDITRYRICTVVEIIIGVEIVLLNFILVI